MDGRKKKGTTGERKREREGRERERREEEGGKRDVGSKERNAGSNNIFSYPFFSSLLRWVPAKTHFSRN
jgi:hypothetical protein